MKKTKFKKGNIIKIVKGWVRVGSVGKLIELDSVHNAKGVKSKIWLVEFYSDNKALKHKRWIWECNLERYP